MRSLSLYAQGGRFRNKFDVIYMNSKIIANNLTTNRSYREIVFGAATRPQHTRPQHTRPQHTRPQQIQIPAGARARPLDVFIVRASPSMMIKTLCRARRRVYPSYQFLKIDSRERLYPSYR
jgi:hypothetical protein